jgi:Bacterial Ig domain
LAKPTYTGDDSAVVYSHPDSSTFTGYSLYKQALAADGVTPVGAPALWLSDADEATIYRRGTFVASTALPTATLVSPTDGQTFNAGATIALQVTASDTGGTVAKVQFYAGSILLGESAAAPYTLNWPNVPAGQYSLVARAINTVGGSGDSAPARITVSAAGARPTLQNVALLNGTNFQFTLSGNVGQAYVIELSTNLVNWSPALTVTNNGTVSLTDSSVLQHARRFFRARLP